MPYYLISLTYDVGGDDEVRLDFNNVEASDQSAALERIPDLLGRIDQMKGHPQIDSIKASSPNPVPKKIDIKSVPAPPPVREGRFVMQQSKKQQDGWVVTDVDYNVVLTFTEHRFEETKRIVFLEDTPADYLTTARIMREIGDWLSENHKDKLF